MIYSDRGYIGCFEMADKDSGKRKLQQYVDELIKSGHRRIIAPINGSTWHTYRLVSWTDGEPFFLLEPQNPIWYNEVFEDLGFRPLKQYRSDIFSIDNVLPLESRNTSVSFRGFRADDLEFIYDIATRSFDENFLYSNITFEDFSRLYQPLLPMMDNDLAIIAEANGSPAGFLFSFAVGGRLVLKSVAVIPEYRTLGIGSVLINRAILAGQKKGVDAAIAALMADDNYSRSIVSKYNSRKIREYTLYCLEV